MLPLLAISLGYLIVILDATAVTVALPLVGRELGGSIGALQWVLDAYTLVFAALLLSAGTLADRLGARRAFLAGSGLFAVASAACGAAPAVGALIAARALQGIGAALLVPSSLALVRAAYPERGAQARALGVWGGVGGAGAAAGPLLGGLLASGAGWRAVFLLNLPIAAAAIALVARAVAPDRPGAAPPAAGPPAPAAPPARAGRPAAPPARAAAGGRRFDLRGQAAAVAACALLTLGLIEAGPRGWADPPVLGALALSVAAFAAFAVRERRAAAPMLPPALLRRPALAGGSAVGLLINLGFYGQLFLVTLVLQRLRGYGAAEAGLALMPQAAMASAGSLAAGRLVARRGARPTMLAGLALGAAGLIGVAAAAPAAPYPLLAPALAATGCGMALTMPAATAAVLGAAPPQLSATAAGALNAARQLGGTIGVALLGTVAGDALGGGAVRAALLLAAAAFAVGAAVTWATVRDDAPPAAPPRAAPPARPPAAPPRPATGAPPPTPQAAPPRPATRRPRSNAAGAGS